jgi:hypothetical protein
LPSDGTGVGYWRAATSLVTALGQHAALHYPHP